MVTRNSENSHKSHQHHIRKPDTVKHDNKKNSEASKLLSCICTVQLQFHMQFTCANVQIFTLSFLTRINILESNVIILVTGKIQKNFTKACVQTTDYI